MLRKMSYLDMDSPIHSASENSRLFRTFTEFRSLIGPSPRYEFTYCGKKMKDLKTFLGASAVVIMMAAFASVRTTDFIVDDGSHVVICHFPGHVNDYVTTGAARWCVDHMGGNVIIVTKEACERGHEASPKYSGTGKLFDCSSSENIGNVDPDVLRGGPGK